VRRDAPDRDSSVGHRLPAIAITIQCRFVCLPFTYRYGLSVRWIVIVLFDSYPLMYVVLYHRCCLLPFTFRDFTTLRLSTFTTCRCQHYAHSTCNVVFQCPTCGTFISAHYLPVLAAVTLLHGIGFRTLHAYLPLRILRFVPYGCRYADCPCCRICLLRLHIALLALLCQLNGCHVLLPPHTTLRVCRTLHYIATILQDFTFILLDYAMPRATRFTAHFTHLLPFLPILPRYYRFDVYHALPDSTLHTVAFTRVLYI